MCRVPSVATTDTRTSRAPKSSTCLHTLISITLTAQAQALPLSLSLLSPSFAISPSFPPSPSSILHRGQPALLLLLFGRRKSSRPPPPATFIYTTPTAPSCPTINDNSPPFLQAGPAAHSTRDQAQVNLRLASSTTTLAAALCFQNCRSPVCAACLHCPCRAVHIQSRAPLFSFSILSSPLTTPSKKKTMSKKGVHQHGLPVLPSPPLQPCTAGQGLQNQYMSSTQAVHLVRRASARG